MEFELTNRIIKRFLMERCKNPVGVSLMDEDLTPYTYLSELLDHIDKKYGRLTVELRALMILEKDVETLKTKIQEPITAIDNMPPKTTGLDEDVQRANTATNYTEAQKERLVRSETAKKAIHQLKIPFVSFVGQFLAIQSQQDELSQVDSIEEPRIYFVKQYNALMEKIVSNNTDYLTHCYTGDCITGTICRVM